MYRFFLRLAQIMAAAGGLVLSALIVMTCLSVLGREAASLLHGLGYTGAARRLGPVQGDFELVEAGMAFAIFAFLPWCQLTQGHAVVDIFTRRLPERAARWLQALIDAVFAAVLVLIAVQLNAGLQGVIRSGQTTFLIQMPLWWAYAASLVGAVAAALIALYVAVLRVTEAVTGRALLPEGAPG